MSSQVKTCSLHIDVKTTDPVKEFVQSTWHKMKAAEEARRKSLKTSVYFSLNLPENYDD